MAQAITGIALIAAYLLTINKNDYITIPPQHVSAMRVNKIRHSLFTYIGI